MKCRLLYLVGQLGPGGLERQLYLLLRTMDRDRYRPEVVVWNYNPDDTYVDPIKSLHVPLHYFASTLTPAKKIWAFRKLVKKIRPGLIHSYTFYTNVAAALAALGTTTIAVGAVRSNFQNDKRSCGILLGNLCAKWPGSQIYNSYVAAEKARKARSVFSPKHIFVVQNRIDLQEFRKYPLSLNGTARIVGIGSLIKLKRWDRLLDAASNLKMRGVDFQVEIAGGGPLRESLERQIQDLGLVDRVRLIGHTNDVASLLATSTFLVHTSEIEGSPNVITEAMACGRPVIATDAGETHSLVDDGKTGFVVRRGDNEALLDRILRLIRDRRLCCRMGTAARIKAEREFGLNCLMEKMVAVYCAAGWSET
jgi:glycosyltransferase involved in cell wall biosynthesis